MSEVESELPVVTTNNLLDLIGDREIVDVTSDYIVVAPRSFYEHPAFAVKELSGGATAIGPEYGTTRSAFTTYGYREDYNPELRGLFGLRVYDKMRRGDGATSGLLLAVKAPINGATWFVEPHDEKKKSKTIAEFVKMNLDHWMTYSWNNILREVLYMLDFGYYMFEKVWGIRTWKGKERIFLHKLAPRHPFDVVEWHYDENGGPRAVDLYNSPGTPEHRRIFIDKLAVFTHGMESGDITGKSLLRPAYKHWYIAETAYRIDGIQKERHGIGIPIITLPPNFTPGDKTLAHEIGRNLRTNESAHVVLPPGWEILFAKLEGQPVSALATAEHHGKMIYQSALAGALWGDSAQGGAEVQMEMFYKSVRHIADAIADTVNMYIIPQLVGFNWPEMEEFPQLKVRKLGDTGEARTLSFALRNYVGAGIVQVDEPLEAWARESINAPMLDKETIREVATPQMGGPDQMDPNVGPPRQAKAQNQRQNQSSQAGRDGGGTGGGGTSQ